MEQFHCPYADGNQHIEIMEKTLQFSSVMLPAPSPYIHHVFVK